MFEYGFLKFLAAREELKDQPKTGGEEQGEEEQRQHDATNTEKEDEACTQMNELLSNLARP